MGQFELDLALEALFQAAVGETLNTEDAELVFSLYDRAYATSEDVSVEVELLLARYPQLRPTTAYMARVSAAALAAVDPTAAGPNDLGFEAEQLRELASGSPASGYELDL